MTPSQKKHEKTLAKQAKKEAKADLKARSRGVAPAKEKGPSPAVRYAEYVRGALYVLMGLSLIAALLLGQRGMIMSLNDVIDSLFAARVGKFVLALIGAALVIYGLKYLRLVR